MTELFDKFKNFKVAVKKHYVVIQDQNIEVSLDKKLEIIRNGTNNYKIKDGEPILKETKTQRNTFPEIQNLTSDPFWPTEEFVWKK